MQDSTLIAKRRCTALASASSHHGEITLASLCIDADDFPSSRTLDVVGELSLDELSELAVRIAKGLLATRARVRPQVNQLKRPSR